MDANGRIAVLVAFSGDGGVENMVTNLVRAWLAEGVAVDLLLIKARGGHVARLPEEARVIRLNARTSLSALPAVIAYLRRERPPCLLAAKDRAGRIAILARWIARVPTRVVLRLGMHLSGSLAGKNALRRWSRWLPVRWLYPHADAFIAVSSGVADDMATHGRLPRDRFQVVANPVLPADWDQRRTASVDHPWLRDGGPPVLLAVGRLRPQKGFGVLLEALAGLRRERRARLIILGEGGEREALERQRDALGLAAVVDMPGFVTDPAPCMDRADVFVLSSVFEGSPNVLVEAMACGTPVVATDCPSGPREILTAAGCGRLVPVGDSRAMACAIAATLDAPDEPQRLRDAVTPYHAATSAHAYLSALRPHQVVSDQ